MKRLRNPVPNRKGVYEVHDVPSRKVGGLLARGWTDVDAAPAVVGERGVEMFAPGRVFNLTGPWMKKRAEVRDALGVENVPASKDEARQWLADAGYSVEG